MEIVKKPIRVATSKPAQQTYLNTLLFIIAGCILLGLAVIAYISFYLSYVPRVGVEQVIWLQYGEGPHPHALELLPSSSIIQDQAYDISLTLHLPLSPQNLETGNFMLHLELLSSSYSPPPPSTVISQTTAAYIPSILTKTQLQNHADSLVFSSRRPALIPYRSRLVKLSHKLLHLPLLTLGWKEEAVTLEIPMAERAEFQRRGGVPRYIKMEVQAGQEIQIYDCKINFTARFGGMRWLMYNHRILSFLFFTFAFWVAELVFTLLGWLALRLIFPVSTSVPGIGHPGNASVDGEEGEQKKVNNEPGTEDEPDLSDTPRSFPTYGAAGRQRPLRYESEPKFDPDIKSEEEEYGGEERKGLEADDEDDELGSGTRGLGRDSGIGTSFSDGAGGSLGVTRRRSRGGRG